MQSDDPARVVDALAEQATPYLIGVRHHSPALAAVVPRLLDAARPDVLLVELPAEFADWLPWLADPATVAPVALAGTDGRDNALAFYPFADFSPELAAVRWAARNGVRVVPCDLPLADRGWDRTDTEPAAAGPASAGPDSTGPDSAGPDSARPGTAGPGTAGPGGPLLSDALRAGNTGRVDDDLWDRAVEARAPGSTPEAVRRAALLVGWAFRTDAQREGGVDPVDLRREEWMRRCVAEALASGAQRIAAVVGAFHAPALHVDPAAAGNTPPAAERPDTQIVTSLVPYTFALLDSRSGYPAGIRDPQWQQEVLAAGGDTAAVEDAAIAALVGITAQVREAGHPAGPGEARQAVQLATGLAQLRGLPAPGRGELVEAVQSVLAQGEVQGRGRVVAKAMERVLVGERRGRVAPAAPRSGLRSAIERDLVALRLPGPGDPPRDLRLDPLRSDLDRRREIALRRLTVCRVPYASETDVVGVGGLAGLTTRWTADWTPSTEASLDVAGVQGVTLAQAAEGALRLRHRRQVDAGGPTAGEVVDGFTTAAACGLIDLAAERLTALALTAPATGTLPELLDALAALDRVRLGHVPGLPPSVLPELGDLAGATEAIRAAAVRQLDGLAGSTDVGDARALIALALRNDVGLRLADALGRLADDGSPLIAAAASAAQVLLGLAEPEWLGERVASWVDSATDADRRRVLQGRLTGLLAASGPLLETGGAVLDGLFDRVETLADQDFLERLPALRGGFHVLSPAGRDRLLAVVTDRLGDGISEIGGAAEIDVVPDPEALLHRLLADRAGRAALERYHLPVAAAVSAEPPAPEGLRSAGAQVSGGELSTVDRWRLVLGRPGAQGKEAVRYASALDELYGAGRGEGAQDDADARAGRAASYPTAREWSEELAVLFGPGVREEVLGRAVEAGRTDAALELDPASARPSVELLQSVLSLVGGVPEATLARLRPLVARLVAELTQQLATRIRPALTGLASPRPTYRPGGPLDLPRTLRANLATTHRTDDGRVVVVPERPVFRTRARRSVDWRLVLVVDVSGSMEASVIWSALTASVLAGVPALTTHFVAFSTDVIDLSDRVDDPLGLLLEVRVGGGTHIAAGLRHARSLVTVPTRTLVAVISDFEEGYSVGGLLSEVRALAESGCTLLGCASLDDAGKPRYSVPIAERLVAAGMPVAALSPLELARWVGEHVR
ncbi:DUF5682 family protein [Cryptosporangium aurantiacum]|uniref:VWA domain containing CoxE-like protein n=1 Tax=Cryptosporangium aurantiacum TaxID=134849 RepID=A0A1M7R8R3_9ACTN|nr:DUF5682 family protein [Cryptosporangium aurantiacum]SHN42725.1 VWA domain containing CoxE-like protein [Cryptosporangium aurantiacum]